MRAHTNITTGFAAITVAAGLVAALSGCSIIGTITDVVEGKEDVFSIEVGDCFNSDLGEETVEVSSVKKPACTEEHDFEAYHAWNISDSEFPEYDEEGVIEAAADGCFAEFEGFINANYDDTSLDFSYFYPSASSWAQSDREVLCMAGDLNGKLTESIKGKGANYPATTE